jgi:enoyl-[acyl-carrier protein] reductase III|tara:strand:- start:5477 stop:6256 length:780 start_codon:yes stop_codon:yes gene_type:complete
MSKQWVIILGCSTGHGAATALELAKCGYGIIGFHFDRGPIKKDAQLLKEKIKKLNGGRAHFWNENAADKDIMEKHIDEILSITKEQPIKLLMHSIAFGSTTNFFQPTPVRKRQMDMTQHVMAHCLIYWTQLLLENNLLSKGSRILGLTSEGSYKAMEGYGPVGVAKASLEAVVRQIGWELGSMGITANTIQAGITPTRALTKISDNWEEWVEKTIERNPMGRVTTPEDVAGLVSLLLSDKANFINCSTIFCDGGEHRSL